MSDSKDLPREVPPTELIFSIDVVGDTTRKRWKGNFRYRVPNLKMKASAEKMRATLNGGLDTKLDPSVQILHSMVAYLRYSIEECPNWWKEADWGYELYDFNVVDAVYKQVEKFQDEWNKAIWGEDEKEAKTPKEKAPKKRG